MRSPISGIAALESATALSTELQRARATTLALYAHLNGASLEVPYLTTINPPLWELGHVAWFQEYWCVRGGTAPNVKAPAFGQADEWFDSRAVPHRARWGFGYPEKRQIEAYLGTALDATLHALDKAESPYFFQLVLAHEHMHAEAMRMTLAALDIGNAASPLPAPCPAQAPARVRVAGGEIALGFSHAAPHFTFDNERPGKTATVAPFQIASAPISNADFAMFVADGGYDRAEFWSADGWHIIGERQKAAKVHAFWEARSWQARWQPGLADEAAAAHLCAYEAEAYARWRGGRLATEAEWHWAIAKHPELAASTGEVWEWTSDTFLPHEGFTADAYAEYSAPWFGNHRVLKGGSAWTHPSLKYLNYRNFYTPERTDVLAGGRVVWNA